MLSFPCGKTEGISFINKDILQQEDEYQPTMPIQKPSSRYFMTCITIPHAMRLPMFTFTQSTRLLIGIIILIGCFKKLTIICTNTHQTSSTSKAIMEHQAVGPLFAILFEEDHDKHYLLVDTIGSGMFGSVTLVKDVATGKIYARKMESAFATKFEDPHAAEVRLFKNHPNIPQLIAFREYHQDIDPDSPADIFHPHRARVATATIWQYCNGGTLGEMAERHLDLNTQGITGIYKMPDQFIWSLFKSMLDVQISIATTEPFIVHGDSHQDNWFLHWENDQSPYPKILLGDFGNSLAWPKPHTSNLDEKPWPIVPVDLTDRLPYTDILARLNWYETYRVDMLFTVRSLQYFMLKPFNFNALPPYRQLFDNAARKGIPLYGYSPMLIRLINKWHQIIDKERDESSNNQQWHDFKNELLRLRDMVHAQSTLDATKPNRCHNDLDVRDLKLPPPPTTPKIWTDITELIRYEADYREMKWQPVPTRVTLSRELVLRPGQYRVVELFDGWVHGDEIPTPIRSYVDYVPGSVVKVPQRGESGSVVASGSGSGSGSGDTIVDPAFGDLMEWEDDDVEANPRIR